MHTLERLAAFIAAYQADGRARQKVSLHIVDTFCALIAATRTNEGHALIRHSQTSTRLSDRVALYCALARLSEIDDIHLAAMITPGAIIIPAAFAIAGELENDTVDDVTAAIIAGYEAMIRFGIAIDGPKVLYRGIWPTYFAAPLGVAAVYSRLAKLDTKQTAHALALALVMASPGVGHHTPSTTARWFAVGHSAARGVDAARAAVAGFTADRQLGDGEFFEKVFGIGLNSKVLGDGLANSALDQVSFKPWCAARQTMAATQAFREMLDQGIAAKSIKAITVLVVPQHLKMIDHGITAGDRISHITSLPYQMAVAGLNPDAAYTLSPQTDTLTTSFTALMNRITIRPDESLLAAGYPNVWPAKVELQTASSQYEHRLTTIPGDPSRPFDEHDAKQKFCRFVAPILGPERAITLHSIGTDALNHPAANLVREIDGIIGSRAAVR